VHANGLVRPLLVVAVDEAIELLLLLQEVVAAHSIESLVHLPATLLENVDSDAALPDSQAAGWFMPPCRQGSTAGSIAPRNRSVRTQTIVQWSRAFHPVVMCHGREKWSSNVTAHS
jgi:hypothetical protein